MSARQVRALLEANSFVFARTAESHMILRRIIEKTDGTKSTIFILVPDHKEIAFGTLGNIAERLGLTRELFGVKN